MSRSPYFFENVPLRPDDNGGPAFPVPNPDPQVFKPNTVDELRQLSSGMTLRDYFAAKAMPVELLNMEKRFMALQTEFDDWEDAQRAVASLAYLMADAMLEERAAP